MSSGSSGYIELAPSPALAGLVDAFWRRDGSGGEGDAAHRVLPDGCLDILVDVRHARAYVVGAMTRAVVVPPRDRGRWLSVRFRPGGAAAVLGGAVATLRDARVDLSELRADANDLIERVVAAPGAQGLAAFETWLAKARRASRVEPLVARATGRLLAPDAPSVEALAADLGVTRQHLTRMLKSHVGLGAKHIARVGRMKRVVEAIDAGRPRGWADAALDAGFYDQSHLIAEIRSLTGLTPEDLARERTGSKSPILVARRVA